MFTFMCVILLSLLVALIIFIVWADAEIDKEVYIETSNYAIYIFEEVNSGYEEGAFNLKS